ncbi:MAG: hypothetical protein RMK89_04505 [Armatimonadota bacterium]|nr:hypothetical protein [Armatimonadota bacterium]MDW8142707.1 hypothetical protein [Armatimonadota bacterium]
MVERKFANFALKVVVTHTVTYFVVGAIAYQLLTKPLYIGEKAIMATFMRTEDEPELWRHVMVWFFPAQILRGLLMALALFPFLDTLISWNWKKRFLVIAGIYIIFGFWASAVAAPGTIEGFVYLRPEFTPSIHLTVQPEIVVQGLLMSSWLAHWVRPHPQPLS